MGKHNTVCEVCKVGKIKHTVFFKINRLGCPLCGAVYFADGRFDNRYYPSKDNIDWAKNHPELA